jgi:phage terminase small subunit
MPRYREGMTPYEKKFVREYLKDLNATKAAIRAGYSTEGAKQRGSELLTRDDVRHSIDLAIERRAARCEITADRVLREQARLAFANMKTFAKWGPNGVELKDSGKLSEDDAACVAELSQTVTAHGGSIRFKLHDKSKALDSVAEHLGLKRNPLSALEALIGLLPREVSEAVRRLVAQQMGYEGDSEGGRPEAILVENQAIPEQPGAVCNGTTQDHHVDGTAKTNPPGTCDGNPQGNGPSGS